MAKENKKKIIEELGRIGNEYAWLNRYMVDWGDGKPRESFRPGSQDASHILPILDNGNILIVHHYRVFGRGWVYELPAGIIDETESPESAAVRECEEETGYLPHEIEPLLTFRPISVMELQSHLFVARKLEKTTQKLEASEAEMTVHEVTPGQLYAMVLDGTIDESQTILTVLLAKDRGIIKIDMEDVKKGHPF